MEPRERKKALRREMRAKLAGHDPEAARAAARAVRERVLALPEVTSSRRLLACLSFGAELDTWGLVERLQADDRDVYVPRVAVGDPHLHVHPYPCALETLSFGLRQPRPGTPELAPEEIDETLDVALVVGLAFDRRGHRLGYGAGYFDRFLAGRAFPAVGLAFELQIVEALPVEEHDVRMDVVVTEADTLRAAR